MSTLSSTTQAVYDAFNRVGLFNEPSFETDRKALAAAIRVAVEKVEFPPRSDAHSLWNEGFNYAQQIVLKEFLDIANELHEVEPFDEEDNDSRFRECMDMINNLQPGDITELMGEEFLEEFRRVSQ